jgi:hypothetical protein
MTSRSPGPWPSRFAGPWRIAEFPNGFAVYDATGRQLGFFYGRTDPQLAGHGGFLMIDDARQIAADFTRLPELLNETSSEVAASSEDAKVAKFETNGSPQDAPETSRLLRTAQASVLTATDLPLVKPPTPTRRSMSFEPAGRTSSQMLRPPSNPRSNWMKFLIPIAVAAPPAGYLFFGDPDPPVNVAVVPQVTTNLSAEFSPPGKAKAPLSEATDITVESRIEPESPVEPDVQTALLQPTVPSDVKPTKNGIEARPANLSQKEGRSSTLGQDPSTCFRSVRAVLQNYPESRPSWTFRGPGHEGTKCWYPTKRTARDTQGRT